MFANFIYFIVALLILSLYEPPSDLPLTAGQATAAFLALAALYAVYVRSRFQSLLNRVDKESRSRLDHLFTQLTTRCAILSLMILAVDIWWLHMPAYLKPLTLLNVLPTLNSLLFLLLFVGYLTLMWVFSYGAHKAIYRSDISRGNYVYSNISFSIPVLIPWVLLFGITDLVQLLPFELPKSILNDPMGQIAYFLVFLVVTAIFAPLLIQRFWRCRSMEKGPVRGRIEALCKRAGVSYSDIVYWPIFGGRMITAAVMGLVARFRYILVTPALLNLLSADEVDQVIAHEIGHVKRRHLLLYLLFFIGFMVISYAAYPISELFFFAGPLLKVMAMFNLNQFTLRNIGTAIILLAGIIIYFRFVFGYFMRNFERQADVYVFELFPTARPLISTFDKIVLSSGQPADKPNWHHFSIKQRVDYLWRCEHQPEWIARQNRKVTNSIIVFVAAFVILAAAAFQLNQMVFNSGSHYISVAELEAYLDQKLNKTVEDGMRYLIIGNFYFEQDNLERAVSAYEEAVILDPKIPDAFNNLAWLLATSKNPKVHDPEKALEYARKALALKKAPHIWDTLAECLYANGLFADAVEAEHQALFMNPEGRENYEKQLRKFEAMQKK